MEMDERLLVEQREVREGITCFYENLYSETEPWWQKVDAMQLSSISKEQSGWLESLFDEEEVCGAITGMNGEMAPRSDGFAVHSSKKWWDESREDVMQFL